jgi:lipopolysaccharide assembly outer membrane protein LptD (OstA)
MNAKVLFAIVILFSSYLFSQTNPAGSSAKSTFTGTYTLRTDQKPQVQSIQVKGVSVYQEDGILSCRSECEVTLGNVLLKADEVDFRTYTGECEARGNVRIKALPVSTGDTRQR